MPKGGGAWPSLVAGEGVSVRVGARDFLGNLVDVPRTRSISPALTHPYTPQCLCLCMSASGLLKRFGCDCRPGSLPIAWLSCSVEPRGYLPVFAVDGQLRVALVLPLSLLSLDLS